MFSSLAANDILPVHLCRESIDEAVGPVGVRIRDGVW